MTFLAMPCHCQARFSTCKELDTEVSNTILARNLYIRSTSSSFSLLSSSSSSTNSFLSKPRNLNHRFSFAAEFSSSGHPYTSPLNCQSKPVAQQRCPARANPLLPSLPLAQQHPTIQTQNSQAAGHAAAAKVTGQDITFNAIMRIAEWAGTTGSVSR